MLKYTRFQHSLFWWRIHSQIISPWYMQSIQH